MSKWHWLVVASVGALGAWLFGPALVGRESFVFRDVGHFYHPLFQWIAERTRAGQLPLWNPYENLGTSVIGEGTTSVFYPPKLLLVLPIDFTLAFNWYIILHLALAAWTSFRLARHWSATPLASGLGAISYAFSGDVLFAHTNVVFLVGAAWLPWALLLVDRTLVERSAAPAVGLGVLLALMVLGGDPQMAYNVVLLAVLGWLVLRRGSLAGEPPFASAATRWNAAALLALSIGTCGLLAAVQILPSREAEGLSARAAYERPRNVFELAWSISGSNEGSRDNEEPWYGGLVGLSTEGHARQVYEFSVGPWRAIEYLWPNISGRQFPTHRRWLSALPAEGRLWVPSLYMGLVPLVLAISAWSLRRAAPPSMRWCSWMVLLSAVMATGGYGLVWWLGEVTTWLGRPVRLPVGDEVGGLYWLATVLLPRYVAFRYPAKLLIVTSLGMSMLAARGWDAVWTGEGRKVRRALAGLAIVSLLAAWGVVAFRMRILDRLAALPADATFGPFDAPAAFGDIVSGLLQTAVVAIIAWQLLSNKLRGRVARLAPLVLVVLTTLDLAIAQRWMVPCVPASEWSVPPRVLSGGRAIDGRVYRAPNWQNASWPLYGLPSRLLELMQWERDTLYPKYPLTVGQSVLDASGTMVSHDYQLCMELVRQKHEADAFVNLPQGSILELFNTRLLLGPFYSSQRRNHKGLGRAWIVHHVKPMSELKSNSPSQLRKRTEEVLLPDGQGSDWRRMAVIETDGPVMSELTAHESSADGGTALPQERCDVVVDVPEHIEIMVQLERPALVVLSDQYYPGWQLTVETDGAAQAWPIVRAERVLRGAMLPTGTHRLIYRYRPMSVIAGGTISALSAVGLGLVMAIAHLRRKRHRAC